MAVVLRRLALLLVLVCIVVDGQKCKLSTIYTKAPGQVQDRTPQTGNYPPYGDCHWMISTPSPNVIVQLDFSFINLDYSSSNDVLLVNLGVDAVIPQGWSEYTRNAQPSGVDEIGQYDYTSATQGGCTGAQNSNFDATACYLTDGTLLTDTTRDGSWMYFVGQYTDVANPISMQSTAQDVYIIFRAFTGNGFSGMDSFGAGSGMGSMAGPVASGSGSGAGASPLPSVYGFSIAYSFVSAYCSGFSTLSPRLDATDVASVTSTLTLKDNVAGSAETNMNCSWILFPYRLVGATKTAFNSIWLTVVADLHGTASLSLYDGTTAKSPLMARFTQANPPHDPLESVYPVVYITYFTDAGPPGKGFVITWQAAYCPSMCTSPAHGTCQYGQCNCNKGWSGAACNIPEGWFCSGSHYNSGDGCDCGCGIYDPDCGSIPADTLACTASPSVALTAFNGAMGRLYNGVCIFCPLPSTIQKQLALPDLTWKDGALHQSCPGVIQCPKGTQCGSTGTCSKVAATAPTEFNQLTLCLASSDCPESTYCNDDFYCEAPPNYALVLTDVSTNVCSIYGLPESPDMTIEFKVQVASPKGTNVLLDYPGLGIRHTSALTFSVGSLSPWITNVNIADGLWHSLAWVWSNANGLMQLYDVANVTRPTLVASTSVSPNVVMTLESNLTLGPFDGAVAFLRLWMETRDPERFFLDSTLAERSNLLAEYRFMDGSARDMSPHGNDFADKDILSFAMTPPQPYACVASPLDISSSFISGSVLSVTAHAISPWSIVMESATGSEILRLDAVASNIDVLVDGVKVLTLSALGATAKAVSIRLQSLTSTSLNVCINDIHCGTLTPSTTAPAAFVVNVSPNNGAQAGLKGVCLLQVASLQALASLISPQTYTTDRDHCTFPFPISVRNCVSFTNYLSAHGYNAATLQGVAQAYTYANLDQSDQPCVCDIMPSWAVSAKITSVDSVTPSVTLQVAYTKIKTTTLPTPSTTPCASNCFMLELVTHHRRLQAASGSGSTSGSASGSGTQSSSGSTAGSSGGSSSSSGSGSSGGSGNAGSGAGSNGGGNPSPGGGPPPPPTVPTGNNAKKYTVKRDFAFTQVNGVWQVLSVSSPGNVSSKICLVTGPDASQVTDDMSAFSCQTTGESTLDTPFPQPFCILNNAKKTCLSDQNSCGLPNGQASYTDLSGSFSDNYTTSVTGGVYICTFNVRPTVLPALEAFAVLSFSVQSLVLSVSDSFAVTNADGTPIVPPLSGNVDFATLPTNKAASSLNATFVLQTVGDKTGAARDGVVVEYDTTFAFPATATSHFCTVPSSTVHVDGSVVFPTYNFQTSKVLPTQSSCTYVVQAPPNDHSFLWLQFLDFNMASAVDRIEIYDVASSSSSPALLLSNVTNQTFATPHYALVFNGVSDFTVSPFPLSRVPLTVMFWIQVPTTVKKDCSVAQACVLTVAKKMKVLGTALSQTNHVAGFTIELAVDTGLLSINYNGAMYTIHQDVRVNKWLHVAFVYRSQDDVAYGYINGARVASTITGAYSATYAVPANPMLFLGGMPTLPDASNVFFSGQLRHVVLFSTAKTSYDINRQMARPCDVTDASLMVCYAISTLNATTLIDSSTNGLHGRFHGTIYSTQPPLQLSTILLKQFTAASSQLLLRYIPASANSTSTFRFLAWVQACPPTCNGHGTCRRGRCHCDVGFSGPQCDTTIASCYPHPLMPSPQGIISFPNAPPPIYHFVPAVNDEGGYTTLDCSWHLRKSQSTILLKLITMDLGAFDRLLVYEDTRQSPMYYETFNLTAAVAMARATFLALGGTTYNQAIFKNVSAVAATAVLWPVGNWSACSKQFHVVTYRRGLACADASTVGLDRDLATTTIVNYWWTESPAAFASQIAVVQLYFNAYDATSASITAEYVVHPLGKASSTMPYPAMFYLEQRRQSYTACQDGAEVGLNVIASLVETATLYKRPYLSVSAYRLANLVDPVFQYAGNWSLNPAMAFSGLVRTPYLSQPQLYQLTVVVQATVVLGTSEQYILSQEENNAGSLVLKISAASKKGMGAWTFGAFGTNDAPSPTNPTSFSQDSLTLAVTFNSGVVTYFVNGLQVGAVDTTAIYDACIQTAMELNTDYNACKQPISWFTDASRLVLGGRFQAGHVLNPWKGQLTKVQIFDHVLPDAVIATLYVGVGSAVTSVSKHVIHSANAPTTASFSTIELLVATVGAVQISSAFLRTWQVSQVGCATPPTAYNLNRTRLALLVNKTLAGAVVYNAFDDTSALVSWVAPNSSFVLTSLGRTKSYGYNLTNGVLLSLLTQYGTLIDNMVYRITSIYVNAIASTGATVSFEFTNALQATIGATTTLTRTNNTWRAPTTVHRLVPPDFGVLPPVVCQDLQNLTVPLTQTSGVITDGLATESTLVTVNKQCSWVLQAPAGQTITLAFDRFDLACSEGALVVFDQTYNTTTSLCNPLPATSLTFGPKLQLRYAIGPPLNGPPLNGHPGAPLPTLSTGFYAKYFFSNDVSTLNKTSVPPSYSAWSILSSIPSGGSTTCALDVTNQSTANPWQIVSVASTTTFDETCYQTTILPADNAWYVTRFDTMSADTRCADWEVDESVPWTADSMQIVGGSDMYTDPPTVVEHAPSLILTQANQSLVNVYESSSNVLQVRYQSSNGGRGGAEIAYYMPTTYYMAPPSYQPSDGSTGDGSRENPFTHTLAYLLTNVLGPGDMIRMYPGRYEGSGYCSLSIPSSIVIESVMGSDWTILDCGGTTRGWQLVHTTGFSIVRGLTFMGCTASSIPITGAALFVSGNALIDACSFTNNVHKAQGTVAIVAPSLTTVRNCIFDSNVAQSGAGVAVLSAAAVIQNSTFVNNNSTATGALFVSLYTEASVTLNNLAEVNVTDSTFVMNKGAKEGGVTIAKFSVVQIVNSVFGANYGSAIGMDSSTVLLDNNTFTANLGSGVVAVKGMLTVSNATFFNNAAKLGAGVYLDNTNYLGMSNAFVSNHALQAGGALFCVSCQLVEQGSQFLGNSVGNGKGSTGGGAMAFSVCNAPDNSIQVYLLQNYFANNSATSAGAVRLDNTYAYAYANQFVSNAATRAGGALQLIGCNSQSSEVVVAFDSNLFQANSAQRGASVDIENSDVLSFTHDMFEANVAQTDGGAVFATAATNIQFQHARFVQCEANLGGAVYMTAGASMSFAHVVFHACTSLSHGGSVYVENSNLTMQHVHVNASTAYGNGGAMVFMSQATSLDISNVTISSCSANKGGAFYVIDSTINQGDVRNVTIVNVSALTMGGAFYSVLAHMTLVNLWTLNSASASGGMMALEDSTATLIDSVVLNATASANGGGFYAIISVLTATNTTLQHNRANNYGGAAYGFASTITVIKSTLTANTALNGGSLYVSSSTLNLDSSRVAHCVAANNGGGVYTDLSDVWVHNTVFESNRAVVAGGATCISNNAVHFLLTTFSKNVAVQGGAMSLTQVTTLMVESCEFANNAAMSDASSTTIQAGGAIAIDHFLQSSSIAHSSFHGNSAGDQTGGAVFVTVSGLTSGTSPTLLFLDDTFHANVAGAGGALYFDTTNVTLIRTLYVENNATAGGGGAIFWQGTLEPRGLTSQNYTNNSALYGPNFASVPVALSVNYTPPAVTPGREWGEASAQTFSGVFLVNVVVRDLVLHYVSLTMCWVQDQYMQTVTTENALEVTLASDTDGAFVTGTSKVKAASGVCNFSAAGVQQMPGHNATLAVTANGMTALDTVDLHIRQCMRGEVTPIGVPQCVRCPFGQFSWNISDNVCHACPVGAVCGGGDAIDALDGYWRFPDSTGICADPRYPYDLCKLPQCLDVSCNGYSKGGAAATVRLHGPDEATILTLNSVADNYQPNQTLFIMGQTLTVKSIVQPVGSNQYQLFVTGPGSTSLPTTGTVDIYQRGTESCKPGYTGNLCFQCANGYTRSGKTACVGCPKNYTLTVAVLVLGIFGVAAVAVVLIIMTINKSKAKADLYSILSKIFTSYMQLVGLAGSFNVDWPREVKAMFDSQSQVSNPGDKLISIQCLMDYYKTTATHNPLGDLSDYYAQLIVFMSLPLCAVIFPVLFWRLRYRLVERRHRQREWGASLNAVLGRGTGADVFVEDDEIEAILAELKEAPSEIVLDGIRKRSNLDEGPQPLSVVKDAFLQATKEEMKDKSILSIIVLMFLVHPGLTNQIFQLYTCTELGYDGIGDRLYYLNPDLDVQCYTSSHWKWMLLVGLPGMIIYTLGIPFFAFRVLHARRHELDLPRTKLQFGFLYDGYKLEYYFWEIWIMMRKVLVSFISVFLKSWGSAPQALGATGLVFAALFGHVLSNPYEEDCVNGLEMKSLLACLFTLYCGLYLLEPSFAPSTRVVFGIFIITANCLFVVAFGKLMIIQVKKKAQDAMSQLTKQKHVNLILTKVRKSVARKSTMSLPVEPVLTSDEIQLKLDKTEAVQQT
ncbi:Aste57867_14103 [Aphanomyces stellatus]|uniref:Aste57867_14103 protein n=1 Tax=Aphanomyces stellatus TaxID=120398 RepID=A0A485L0D3_9STRA|nr:hypothetical protein As57867_014052 [Aphanomyces stellatus]VFT90931.1 Aste57867_14103 [Aphanomyces stellatus]